MSSCNKFKKIYVAIPSEAVSGGGETLHQLVSTINNNGGNAFVFYYDNPSTQALTSVFNKYNLQFALTVEDESCNAIIVPEMHTDVLRKYKKISRIVWWLSRDYYLKSLPKENLKFLWKEDLLGIARSKVERNRKNALWLPIYFITASVGIIKTASFKSLSINELKSINTHLYNCEYARLFLEKHGISKDHNLVYLCGPVNNKYFDSKNNPRIKDNILLYNPAKSDYFTSEIISALKKNYPYISVIPLRKMSIDEMIDAYSKAKVYMDFGSFPGPERVPREAALFDCNIIVGNRGSASNDIDYPILNEFKFDITKDNIDIIIKKIDAMMNNYHEDLKKFDVFREKVLWQKNNFERIVVETFC